jgi:hypothetical protein
MNRSDGEEMPTRSDLDDDEFLQALARGYSSQRPHLRRPRRCEWADEEAGQQCAHVAHVRVLMYDYGQPDSTSHVYLCDEHAPGFRTLTITSSPWFNYLSEDRLA